MKSAEFRTSLIEGFRGQRKLIEDRYVVMDADLLAKKPDKNTWSVAQCLYHILLTNNIYMDGIDTILKQSKFDEPSEQEYKSNWMGKKFIEMNRPGAAMYVPVPKLIIPKLDDVPDDVVRLCLDQLEKLCKLVTATEGVDLIRTKVPDPIIPIFKFQLGDCLEVMHVHNERHLLQAGRLH